MTRSQSESRNYVDGAGTAGAACAGIEGVAEVTGFAGASPKMEYLTVLAT